VGEWLDGWMDGWMAGWMSGWLDGWLDGCFGWVCVCGRHQSPEVIGRSRNFSRASLDGARTRRASTEPGSIELP
jgi:hypothetical protein